jgi:hypothetical protein
MLRVTVLAEEFGIDLWSSFLGCIRVGPLCLVHLAVRQWLRSCKKTGFKVLDIRRDFFQPVVHETSFVVLNPPIKYCFFVKYDIPGAYHLAE